MLAGHDECDGKVENGVMKFYGMASESAMSRHGNHNAYRGVKVRPWKWNIAERQMTQLKIFLVE